MSDNTDAATNAASDAQLPPNPVGKEPAEGGTIPDAGPGAEHADDAGAGATTDGAG